MVRDEGRTGAKSGRGFCFWKDGAVEKFENVTPPETDFTDRLILPMIDACVECLRKGVAEDADHIDATLVFWAGFAPFRGGPLH